MTCGFSLLFPVKPADVEVIVFQFSMSGFIHSFLISELEFLGPSSFKYKALLLNCFLRCFDSSHLHLFLFWRREWDWDFQRSKQKRELRDSPKIAFNSLTMHSTSLKATILTIIARITDILSVAEFQVRDPPLSHQNRIYLVTGFSCNSYYKWLMTIVLLEAQATLHFSIRHNIPYSYCLFTFSCWIKIDA